MVGVDDGAQILGSEPGRELGRAGQVAEQDGKLTPFGFGRGGRRGLRRKGRRQPITDIHRAIVGGFAVPGYSAASAAAQPRNAGSWWVTT
jgi:hypothetical protein